MMNNKERYIDWCQNHYVPIFSKPFWMDAVCEPDNWDVWLYESGGNIIAVMPYYRQLRGAYHYITKAPLTQNNGILFEDNAKRKLVSYAELQEKVINAACEFIRSLNLDVYEQQFHHSFDNWSPFYWNGYSNILRYTYIIQDTSNLERVIEDFSANYRKNIRKGQKLTHVDETIDPDRFYIEHKKIFDKQNLPVPISKEFWDRLYATTSKEKCGQLLCARDVEENIHSVMFVVWDEKALYPLLGGYMPEFSNSQSYPALTYYSIQMAHDKGLAYDFEGSMIQRIAKSFRQFGGVPTPYYRIRKVFNPEIIRKEAEAQINKIVTPPPRLSENSSDLLKSEVKTQGDSLENLFEGCSRRSNFSDDFSRGSFRTACPSVDFTRFKE